MDIATGMDLPVPPGIADPGLVNVTGLLSLGDDHYLFSSKPILTSLDEGPPRGHLAMARRVDESVVASLRDLTRLDLSLRSYGQGDPQGQHIQYLNTTHLVATATMSDILGSPTLVVTLSQYRNIYSEGYTKTTELLLFILLYGVVVDAAFLVYTDRVLLSRLSRLSSEVGRITLEKDITRRLGPSGEDEIGALASDINKLLGSIVEARRDDEHQKEAMERLEKEHVYDLIDGARRVSERIGRDMGRPLQSMRVIAGTVRDEHPEAADLANLLESDLDHVEKLLYEVSSLASPETLKKTFIDLYEVLSMTLDSVNIPGNVEVHREYSDSFIAIHGDFQRLSRVVRELLWNSVEALDGGGGVWVGLRQVEGYAEVTVRDDGPGLSPEARESLFRPFRSTKARAMGLGLVYSKEVVEAHDGTISVSGPDAGGVTVTIRLPLHGGNIM